MKSRWLTIARVFTMAAIGFLLVILALDIAFYPTYVSRIAEDWTPNVSWTREATNAALVQLGWQALDLSNFFFVVNLLFVGVLNCVLGLFILRKKSRDGFGLFLAFVFVLSGTTGIGVHPSELVIPALHGLNESLGIISWQLGFILFYLFPDGQFVPRWTRWLLLGWLGINLYSSFRASANSFDPITLGVSSLLVFSTLGSQVYRYFRHADAIGRQQTKVLVSGLLLLGVFLPIAMLPFLIPSTFLENGGTGLFWTVVIRALTMILANLIPVSIGIAILRYRLWDIDVIIRRTLTYALVTALLLSVFFGSVILLQQLFSSITGSGQNELVTVLSTLAIAALFVPIRNRMQLTIDKRFNRKKYDAQRVLQEFATTVRDETDLEKLTGRLMEVVDQTMQPRSVSVWLKATDDGRRKTEARP